MKRVTLRLPETLFQRLELLAHDEGISLNQYLVYSLTKHVSRTYRPIPISKEERERQLSELQAIIDSFELISEDEFDQILAAGKPVQEHERLDPEIEAKLKSKIAAARAKKIQKEKTTLVSN